MSFFNSEIILPLIACGSGVVDCMHGTDVVASETPCAVIAPAGTERLGIVVRRMHCNIPERTVRGAFTAADARIGDAES